VQIVNRLAVCSGIVRNAIRRGLCTDQLGSAERHLNVTVMVGCDRMLELDHLTTGVSRSDGFWVTATSIHAIVVPGSSDWHFKVAVTVRA